MKSDEQKLRRDAQKKAAGRQPPAIRIAQLLVTNYQLRLTVEFLPMPLILASASPRRAELLRNAAISFEIDPAHVPEAPQPGEVPRQYAMRLARDKAVATASRHPNAVVLGADTVVVVDEHLLEKPADAADARRMLRLLSGRTHQVITGVCLIAPGFEAVEAECTDVTFLPMSDEDIAYYVGTGEPMDKAGAYGIQGIASRWVERVGGCYFNVVGLPVARVYGMLSRCQDQTGLTIVGALAGNTKRSPGQEER